MAIHCTFCDTVINPGETVCSFCGTPVEQVPEPVKETASVPPSAPNPQTAPVKEIPMDAPMDVPSQQETPAPMPEAAPAPVASAPVSVSQETPVSAPVPEIAPVLPKGNAGELRFVMKKESAHVCSGCGKVFTDNTKFCGECGGKVEVKETEVKTDTAYKTVVEKSRVCSGCGKVFTDNTKFCGECGGKVEEKETAKEIMVRIREVTQNACSKCGKVYTDGTKFCGECGGKVEEKISYEETPVQMKEVKKYICSGCGKEFPSATKFCGECGGKVEEKITQEVMEENYSVYAAFHGAVDDDEEKEQVFETLQHVLNITSDKAQKIIAEEDKSLLRNNVSYEQAKKLVEQLRAGNIWAYYVDIAAPRLHNAETKEEIENLLQAGADLEARNEEGYTPLLAIFWRFASDDDDEKKCLELMRVLLQKGADPEAEAPGAEMGLLEAVEDLGTPEMAALLGIDTNEEEEEDIAEKTQNNRDKEAEELNDKGDDFYDEENYTQAREYYKQALEMSSDASLQKKYLSNIAYTYTQEENFKQAVKYFTKAEDNSGLSFCYNRHGNKEEDCCKAFQWYQKACEVDPTNARALDNLAYCYYNGNGVKQDFAKAFHWYMASAKLNNYDGLYNVATCYSLGEGVEENEKKAVEYLLKAVELTDESDGGAEWWLATDYENGDGIQENFDKAVYWYQRAASLGQEKAKEWLQEHGIGDDAKSGDDAEKTKDSAETENSADNEVLYDPDNDFMLELTGLPHLYLAPEIPQNLLNNALAAYAPGISADEVVGLIDETLTNNGKNGMLITTRALCAKSTMFQGKTTIPLSANSIVKASNLSLEVNGASLITFVQLDDKDAVSELADALNVMIRATGGKPSKAVDWIIENDDEDSAEKIGEESSAEPANTGNTSMKEVLRGEFRKVNYQKYYAAPQIPQDKLHNAISAYASDVNPEDVFALFDGTVFGSAKEGMLVTWNAIYTKYKGQSAKIIRLKHGGQMYTRDNGLLHHLFYENKEFVITMTNEVEARTFASAIQSVINQL